MRKFIYLMFPFALVGCVNKNLSSAGMFECERLAHSMSKTKF